MCKKSVEIIQLQTKLNNKSDYLFFFMQINI